MRIVAVLIGIVGLLVFSLFLMLVAPTSQQVLATTELVGIPGKPAPATGVLYHLSRVVIQYYWLYWPLVLAVCALVAVGAVKNKIGPATAWIFAAFSVLLNILAIAMIRLVEVQGQARF